jgi:hypothetical protein
MVAKLYFEPRPAGVLHEIFRYWAHLKKLPAAMEAELNRQIKTRGITVDPPLHPDWKLRQAGFEFHIKDEDGDWLTAASHRYQILRWEVELYGPPRADPTPAPPETKAIVRHKAKARKKPKAKPGTVEKKPEPEEVKIEVLPKVEEKPKAEIKLVTRYTKHESPHWKAIILHLRKLRIEGELSDLNAAYHVVANWRNADKSFLAWSRGVIYRGLQRHGADWDVDPVTGEK